MEPYATGPQLWASGLVFLRAGAIVMLVPGLGETYVPVRARLALALVLALCLGPIAAASLPPLPTGVGDMAGFVIKELLVGLMIGALMRMFIASLGVAGELVSLQTTLSFAQTANPTQAQPGTILSTFLTLLGLTMVFDTGLHHLFLGAIARSYTLFPPARPLPINDAAALAVQTTGKVFALGLQLAAPVVAFSLVFNIATGFVGRMMPQFQIFFVATPLSLLLGLSIFALSLGSIGLVWLQGYEQFLHIFT